MRQYTKPVNTSKELSENYIQYLKDRINQDPDFHERYKAAMQMVQDKPPKLVSSSEELINNHIQYLQERIKKDPDFHERYKEAMKIVQNQQKNTRLA